MASDRSFQRNPGAPQIFEGQPVDISPEDLASLKTAVAALERSSLVARVSAFTGRQLDILGRFIPARFSQFAQRGAAMGLRVALHTALAPLKRKSRSGRMASVPEIRASKLRSRQMLAMTGAAGGAFGLGAMALELPVSTTLMLRSIGEIAAHEGEDLREPGAAIACLEVLALGGGKAKDAAAIESSYFATRIMLAQSVQEAVRYLATAQVIDESAPVLVRLVTQIAARFGVTLSQKLAAQAIPVIGAMGGASVNYAFIAHFQHLAHGHFTVRRLERKYGALLVREHYELLAKTH